MPATMLAYPYQRTAPDFEAATACRRPEARSVPTPREGKTRLSSARRTLLLSPSRVGRREGGVPSTATRSP